MHHNFLVFSLTMYSQAVMAEGKENAVAIGHTKMSTEKM